MAKILRVPVAGRALAGGGAVAEMGVLFERYALIFLIIWHTFHLWVAGKYSANVDTFDAQQMVAHLMALAKNGSALWYPDVAGGVDRLAFGWVPPGAQWLFSLLPAWIATAALRIIVVAAGVVGAWKICRLLLPGQTLACLFAAFAAGQYVEHLLSQSIFAVIPLSGLLLADIFTALSLGRWRYWLSVVFSGILLSLFSSIAYLVLFPPLFVALSLLLFLPGQMWRVLTTTALVFSFVYLLRAADIWAMLVQVSLSYRPLIPPLHAYDLPSLHLAWLTARHAVVSYWVAVTLLPASLLACALGGIGLFGEARLRRIAAIGIGVFLLCAVVETSYVTAATVLSARFPVLRSFSSLYLYMFANLALYWAGAAGAVVVADLARRHATRARVRQGLVWAPLFLLALFSVAYKAETYPKQWLATGNVVRNFESPVLGELRSRIADEGAARVVPLDIDPTLQGAGLEMPGGFVPLYPRNWFLFWKAAVAPSRGIDPAFEERIDNGNMLFLPSGRLFDPEGRGLDLSTHVRMELLSLANVGYVISRYRLTDSRLEAIGLGAPSETSWYSMSGWQKARINVAENLDGRTNFRVYRNLDALPRARLARGLEVLADDKQVLSALTSRDFASLVSRVPVAAAEDIPAALDGYVSGRVVFSLDGDNAVAHIDRDQPGAALLVVANSFSPFWRAEAEGGLRLPLFAAYGLFWGVVVPADVSEVRFTYRPPYAVLPNWFPPFR